MVRCLLPVLPLSLSVPVFTYHYSLNFLGRSANILASLPYAVGNLQGKVIGADAHLYRSRLLDSVYRLSVNLKGGPALPLNEFVKWRQKMLIGVSLKVVAPTGQYDPTKLINLGNHRWAFKPEIGYSQRWGHWVVDAYGAAWFYTTNPEFFSDNQYFPGTRTQSENPVATFEGHLSYDFKPRLWGLAGREFLVRRQDEPERSAKSKSETNELAHRGHSRGSHLQTSIAEDQLQQRRVHQLRRKLSAHFSGLAVFLGWLAEMRRPDHNVPPARTGCRAKASCRNAT
jgi:hypothetical protein